MVLCYDILWLFNQIISIFPCLSFHLKVAMAYEDKTPLQWAKQHWPFFSLRLVLINNARLVVVYIMAEWNEANLESSSNSYHAIIIQTFGLTLGLTQMGYVSLLSTNICASSFATFMMTSSNGHLFRVTGHLCGEFTGPRWIPRTKASDAEHWCFLWSTPE